MKKSVSYLFVIVILYLACTDINNQESTLAIKVKEISVASSHGGEPNLSVSSDGEILLSWIEYKNDSTDVLKFSRLENDKWSDPIKIAEGNNWFVNWADFPSLKAYADSTQHLAAHWLQKSDKGTYDYDVRVSQSTDAGKTWSPSFIIHDDGLAAEHGFVSMMPISSERMLAAWLDGRNTKGNSHDSNHNGHQGAMTLRTAEFDIEGNIFNEEVLDNKVCDCCQTDMAMTNEGPIIVYRDRLEGEIRDISYVRKINNKWSQPKLIARDNWLIAGCPVNGPSVAAEGNKVIVAWYTMQNDTARVKMSFSNDNGTTFQTPIEISKQNPLGRVDVIFHNKNEAAITWMESNENDAVIKLVSVNQFGVLSDAKIITTSKSSRSSGFPRMVKNDDHLIMAWTNVEDEITYVKSTKISMSNKN